MSSHETVSSNPNSASLTLLGSDDLALLATETCAEWQAVDKQRDTLVRGVVGTAEVYMVAVRTDIEEVAEVEKQPLDRIRPWTI